MLNKSKEIRALLLGASLVLSSMSVQASDILESNKGLSVRPSSPKDISDREVLDPGQTMGDILGNYYENIANGNLTNGEQSDNTHLSGATDYDDPDIVKNNTTSDKTALLNKKVIISSAKEIQDIIAYAKSKVGNNYLHGGKNPDVPYPSTSDGTDCSGYIWAIFDHFNIKFTRSTASDYSLNLGVQINESERQPGDIMFFGKTTNPNSEVTHIGMYIGDNKIIHASGTQEDGGQIKITELSSNPNGGLKMPGQALVRTRRVLAAGKNTLGSSNSTPTGNQTQTDGGSGTIANIDKIKAKGSPTNVVKTKLEGYGANTAIMYSVGGKYTIGIDPGHQAVPTGGMSEGATSELSGIPEYKLALIQAEFFREALNKAGYNVLMTRTTNDAQIDNKDRGKLFTKAACDMSVSLHYDSATGKVLITGPTFVHSNAHKNSSWNKRAEEFDGLHKSKLSEAGTGLSMGRYKQHQGLQIFQENNVPFYLLELGFISDATPGDASDSDCAIVETDTYRKAVADAFVKACNEFFV